MKLTRSQAEVLTLLDLYPRQTTKTTHHGYVSGASAASLIAKGLAQVRESGGLWLVEITDAGRAALALRNNR